MLNFFLFRRVRPVVPSHDCVAPVREEEQPRATSTRQFGVEGGNRRHSRLDAKMLHAGGMGEKAVAIETGMAGDGKRFTLHIANGVQCTAYGALSDSYQHRIP